MAPSSEPKKESLRKILWDNPESVVVAVWGVLVIVAFPLSAVAALLWH